MPSMPEPGAAEAAASVRFQPTDDPGVCPACYHPPHWDETCSQCLCVKVRPRDSQAVDVPVDKTAPTPKRGKHRGRRKITRAVVLSRLRIARWRR